MLFSEDSKGHRTLPSVLYDIPSSSSEEESLSEVSFETEPSSTVDPLLYFPLHLLVPPTYICVNTGHNSDVGSAERTGDPYHRNFQFQKKL